MAKEKEFATTEQVNHLKEQIPNPYQLNKWYPATVPTGKKCEIKKTNNTNFLHFRYMGTLNTVTHEGEIISSRECWFYSRINLITLEVKGY